VETNSATAVGTVVGVTSTTEFQMQVRPNTVNVQDLVAVDTLDGECRLRAWAKVTTIERLNPLFPREAAQELAFQGRDPFDSVVSMSREMITATCTVIGVEREGRLEPPKYPVQPAGRVYVPPAREIEDFLSGGIPEHRRLRIGNLRGNDNVRVYLDGHMIVSRHLAVLASTGAGKTVATRKILEELMGLGYPILIFDPHGDYAGLHIAQRTDVVTYLPQIRLQDESPDQVLSYLRGLSGEIISAPQEQFAAGILAALQDEKSRYELDAALEEFGYAPLTKSLDRDHFFALAELADRIAELKAVDDRRPLPDRMRKISQSLNCQSSTANAVARQCRRAGKQYLNMVRTNKTYSGDARELPSTQQLHELIAYKRVSIVSLEGYSDELRQSIVANLMQQLLQDRVGGKIPRFLTVIEEAHNFIPGWTAVGDNDRVAPSLPVIKQIATEGRKYGMGLILISQRPSRIDATVLSQANSYLILRIVNPNDQRYIRDVVETLGEAEAHALPNLSTGEALLSGSFVRIPVMVRVDKSISEGKHEEEDFLKDLPGPGSSA